jgi:cytochrome c-type biogenesis protein CcsB
MKSFLRAKSLSLRVLVTPRVTPWFAAFVVAFFATSFAPRAQATDQAGIDALRSIPVQDAGRIKPFDTLARESLQLVYGLQEYESPRGDKRPAVEIVMTWMLVPQYWDGQQLMQVTHRGLKDSLKLNLEQKRFTPNELIANPRLPLVFQELVGLRQTKQKLSPYYQAVQQLETQLGTYQAFKAGQAIRVVPPAPTPDLATTMAGVPAAAGATEGAASAPEIPGAKGPKGQPPIQQTVQQPEPERWTPVADLKGDLQTKYATLIRAFIQTLPNETGAKSTDSQEPKESLADAVNDFKAAARAQNPKLYPDEKIIALEVHEKTLQPFLIAWILYLLAVLILAVAWQLNKPAIYKLGWLVALLAFGMHSYGFGLRMYLMGRPPVSNMYESVIWVSWGCVVFSMIFESIHRRKFILIAGASVAIICLIVADLAPAILDSSLNPLEPVLRSNMWLTIHVLTITLSYSAYFLAWGLGNIGLGFILRGDKSSSERSRMLVQSIYRAVQVGVVLLASGIILGGIWADYSWGRFWGWDPKETWALIALLGYLAMLHGRLIGWIQNFGMMVASVIAFNLVLMAWYGVNYVLGAGLHSYGFGAGGVQYVAGFVILNLIYVGYVTYIRSSHEQLRKI